VTELVAGEALSRNREGWQIRLAPQTVAVLEFAP